MPDIVDATGDTGAVPVSVEPPATEVAAELPATVAVVPVVDGAADDPAAFVLQLTTFEGPLALLLHLLDERRLEITEVSLLAVTEQYLKHLRGADRLNLDALAEFIGVGARLLLLKSRALLPRDPDAAPIAAEDDADPEDLIRALQEYRRFRYAAEQLRELESEHRMAYRRGAPPPALPPALGLEGVTLATLVGLLREVLERAPEERPVRAMPRERVRLADRVRLLMDRLRRDGQTSFRSLLSEVPATRLAIIVEFLAVLELIKVRFLDARQSEVFGDIDLVRLDGDAAGAEDAVDLVADELEGF